MAPEATKPAAPRDASEAFLADPVLQGLAEQASAGDPQAIEAMAARVAWHVATGLVSVERGRAVKDLLNVALSGRPTPRATSTTPSDGPQSPRSDVPSWESAISGIPSASGAGGNGGEP